MPAANVIRPVILIDSSKMDYFARAAMVRAGTYGSYGLGNTGLGSAFDWIDPSVPGADVINTEAEAQADAVATEDNTSGPSIGSTVGGWLLNLGNSIFAPPKAPPPRVAMQQPSMMGAVLPILIGGAVLVGGVMYFASKKR